MRGRYISFFFAAGLIGLLIMVGCSGDKGGGPVSPKAQTPANQYEFYIGNTYWPPLEIYKGTIGDKNLQRVELPGNDSTALKTMALSADGSAILLITDPWDQPDRFLALNAVTLDTLSTYENIGNCIVVSPGGKYVAVYYYAGWPATGINILDGSTLAFLFKIDINIGSLRFTRDDSKFYYTPPGSHYGIYDLEKREIDTFVIYTTSYGYKSSIDIVQPSNDEKYVYVQTHYGGWPILEIYDQAEDSVIAVSPLGLKRESWGDMRLSPDGRLIIWTDPGGGATDDCSYATLLTSVIDARTGEVLAVLYPPVGDPDCDDMRQGMAPGGIAFTPDSRYTIFSCGYGVGYAIMDNNSLSWVDMDLTVCSGVMCAQIACRQK